VLFTGEDGRTGEGDVPVTVMAFAQQSATLLMRSRRAGRRVTLSSRRCAGRERGGPGALRRHLHRLPRGDGAGRAQQEAALQPRIHLHCLRRARAPGPRPALGLQWVLLGACKWAHSPRPQASCLFRTACGARASVLPCVGLAGGAQPRLPAILSLSCLIRPRVLHAESCRMPEP